MVKEPVILCKSKSSLSYQGCLNNNLDLHGGDFSGYVFEKPEPLKDKNNGGKDGLHIIICFHVVINKAVNRLAKQAREKDIFKDTIVCKDLCF